MSAAALHGDDDDAIVVPLRGMVFAWRTGEDRHVPERSVSERLEILESKVQALETLPARVAAVELQIVQLREEMRVAFSATREDLRTEIRAGDKDTRHEMHTLHHHTLALLKEGDEETRREMHTLHHHTLALLKEGDEETRRYMRVLHEEVISRIATIQEAHPREKQ